jgi:hypothetical protein
MPLLRHNRPDERRASPDTKIVSNLHEQKQRPGRQIHATSTVESGLGIGGFHLYGDATLKWQNFIPVLSAAVAT